MKAEAGRLRPVPGRRQPIPGRRQPIPGRRQAPPLLYCIRLRRECVNVNTQVTDDYTQLIMFLDQQHVQYRLIEHAPEGRTELVSAMRGNTLSQAAKCIILMVKIGKKITRYILAVVPGDTK